MINQEQKPDIAIQFCRRCGKRIPSDSEFCNYCGTAVVRVTEDKDSDLSVKGDNDKTESERSTNNRLMKTPKVKTQHDDVVVDRDGFSVREARSVSYILGFASIIVGGIVAGLNYLQLFERAQDPFAPYNYTPLRDDGIIPFTVFTVLAMVMCIVAVVFAYRLRKISGGRISDTGLALSIIGLAFACIALTIFAVHMYGNYSWYSYAFG